MKELLKHRIDRLMERAIAGDPDAQLKLAKEFVCGRIVEKSQENARYWAFKAVDGGNASAISFYNSIASDYHASLSGKTDKILFYVKWIPLIEFFGAIILLLVLPSDENVNLILEWFAGVGITTLLLESFMGKILNKIFKLSLDKGIALIILVIHIIGLFIAYS